MEPELVEPELVEPELVEPELVEPELVEPELVEPELVEPELVKQLGMRVREERLKRHWTQKDLCARANVVWHEKFPDHPPIQEKWLWTFEHAKISSTNLDWVAALADALGVSLSALLAPSAAEESTPEERRWRVVMRMHGVDPSVIEDIVHSIRTIEESEKNQD